MRSTSIYSFFAFGYNYNWLRNHSAGASKAEVINQITNICNRMDALNLPVTKQAAQDLFKYRDKLSAVPDGDVDDDTSQEIIKIIADFDKTLDAELQLKKVFLLTPKRYDLDRLMDAPGELLGKGVFDQLPPATAKDFTLGCRQIALSQSTASAFHLMRAAEGEVKNLYFAFKRTKRLDKPMWGPMIAQLRAKNNPKPSKMLLDHLDHIRENFRNPTQHPDTFYNIDQAQDLLNSTVTAINMIRGEMPKPKAKAKKP